MAMTTRGSISHATETRDADVKGGGVIETCPIGKPSVADGASVQSPAGLRQPKTPTVVATFSGNK